MVLHGRVRGGRSDDGRVGREGRGGRESVVFLRVAGRKGYGVTGTGGQSRGLQGWGESSQIWKGRGRVQGRGVGGVGLCLTAALRFILYAGHNVDAYM